MVRRSASSCSGDLPSLRGAQTSSNYYPRQRREVCGCQCGHGEAPRGQAIRSAAKVTPCAVGGWFGRGSSELHNRKEQKLKVFDDDERFICQKRGGYFGTAQLETALKCPSTSDMAHRFPRFSAIIFRLEANCRSGISEGNRTAYEPEFDGRFDGIVICCDAAILYFSAGYTVNSTPSPAPFVLFPSSISVHSGPQKHWKTWVF
jgi:hypothetical protein